MTGQGLSSSERHRLAVYAQRLLVSALHQAARVYFKHTCVNEHGWRSGFEYLIWDLLHQPSDLVPIDAYRARQALFHELEDLLQLSQDAGGWMTWSPALGKLVFVPSGDWCVLFAAYHPARPT